MADEDQNKGPGGSGTSPGSGGFVPTDQGSGAGLANQGQNPQNQQGPGVQWVDPSIAMNIQLQAALMAMSQSFNAMTDQAKQNNKTFLNDLPFFGVVKEPGERRNIVPLTECVKFIAMIDTETDKNDFTEEGKISVF